MKEQGNIKIQKLMGILYSHTIVPLYKNSIRVVLALFLLASVNNVDAQTVDAVECFCLNNEATEGDGQFLETITIHSIVGENWTISAVVGLFESTSPDPPTLPIQLTLGTSITHVGGGEYVLLAKRRDRSMWNIQFTNGDTTLNLSSAIQCTYPREIIGDFGACIDSDNKQYSLNLDADLITNINWTVVSGGAIVGSNTNPSVEVDWNGAVGTGFIRAQGTAMSYPGQINGLCDFDIMDTVDIVDEPSVFLACDNNLNITLDGMCELVITPDLILEVMDYPNSSYDIILRDPLADTLLPGNVIGMDYIDQYIEVSVVHECSENSCWGTVRIEDKAIPPLLCDDITISCEFADDPVLSGSMPLPIYAFYTQIGPRKYLVQDFDFCSDVILEFDDEEVDTDCEDDYVSITDRTWWAADMSGNKFTCTQRIYALAADAGDITFPPSYDDVLGAEFGSLQACDDWPKLPNGNPDPDFTGYPEGVMCKNVHIHYDDTRFDICAGNKTFKIRRNWVVSDICSGETFEGIQTLTVMDTMAPICVPPDDFVVGTHDNSCGSSIKVPIPEVDDCIEWEYTVAFKPVDESEDPYTGAWNEGIILHEEAGQRYYVITDLPATSTQYWISYYIFDECGNTTRCYTTVTIEDRIQPIPVCKQYTILALNEDGYGWAGPEAFDDGSYDNCLIDYLELRRMDTTYCGQTNIWRDKVMFCCEDVGDTIMVEMRVVDKSGNHNSCMIEVWVQDNTPPEFTFCPADITIDCGDEIWDLSIYGHAEAYDACGVTVTETENYDINDCGVGTITRTFTATDSFNNKENCYQVISVEVFNPFNADSIMWPLDYTYYEGCKGDEVLPESLPEGYMYPKFKYTDCSRPGYEYHDVIFQYADGACFKILREWSVIDWCQFDSKAPEQTQWKHTQVIKVLNSSPPVITKGCNQSDLITEDLTNCQARMQIMADGTDDCGPHLHWEYEIDLDNDGDIDISGEGNQIDEIVYYGYHKVTWYADDECGNRSKCVKVFHVRDNKAPTPVCFSKVVSVVMPSTKQVTIWAKDFIKQGLDNCTLPDDLRYSFTTDIRDSFRLFTCDDTMFINNPGELKIYVTDEAGNTDYCETSISIQDNAGVCEGVEVGLKVEIFGRVVTPGGSPMEGVAATIISAEPEFPKVFMTKQDGRYSFNELPMYKNYGIKMAYDSPAADGVSTLDIIMAQRHILSLDQLNTPYKMLAADVSGDGRLTAGDLVQMRKLLLGFIDEFDVNTWQFAFNMHEDSPFLFESEAYYQGLEQSMPNTDFVSIKAGDVNNSFEFNGNTVKPRAVTFLTTDQTNANKNEEFVVFVKSDMVENFIGLQMGLNYNADKVEYVGVESARLQIKDENIGANLISNGKLSISYNLQESESVGGTLMGLRFKAKKNLKSENVITISDDLQPELYVEDQNSKITPRAFELKQIEEVLEVFEVYQNTPNPFSTSTTISFKLPQEGTASLKIFDLTGKQVYSRSDQFSKGVNHFEVGAQELGVSGVLYYQVDNENHRSVKKMIIIK